MRVEAQGGTYFVRESIAIIEYFEEILGTAEGYEDLRGETVQQRARTRDVLSLLGDAVVWSGVALVHSNTATTAWSGLREEDMSVSAAAHARMKFGGLMGKLESWVGEGEGMGGTLADVCVMAQVEYIREMYGVDWLEGFEGLKGWCERAKGLEWVVGREGLEGVEKTGRWEDVLGS